MVNNGGLVEGAGVGVGVGVAWTGIVGNGAKAGVKLSKVGTVLSKTGGEPPKTGDV